MGLPNVTSNYKGYAESNVYNKVKYLHDKMFYLVHGTADDNVQFQQSMALARHLAREGVLFRQQVLQFFFINIRFIHIQVIYRDVCREGLGI